VAAPTCDPQDARMCSAPLKAGEAAPYAGQLLTPELAIRLGQRAEYCDTRIKAEVELATKLGQVDLGLERKLRQADNEANAAMLSATRARYERALEEAAPPWWERPWFVTLVAASATATLLTFAVWGAGQLGGTK
jgi:hypothetical protein